MLKWTFPVGPLQCNCSIIADEESREAVLIDPGDEVAGILGLLRRERLHLTQIVITHAHLDHIGGAAAIKQQTGAPVFLHSADAPLYAGLEWQARWLGMATPERTAIDASLRQDQSLSLATQRIEVIETPGHTPGSVSLYLPAQGWLFAGDTLFAGSVGRTDLPGGDARQLLDSLHEKLLLLPEATMVIPGHGPETTIGTERTQNPFLTGRVRLA